MTASESGAPKPDLRLVDADRVRIEFQIEDLLRQIQMHGLSPVASCNGCNTCSATINVERGVTE